MTTIPQLKQETSRRTAIDGGQRRGVVGGAYDFAVGFSRQPLPNGRRFASITNTGAAGIKATDASTCLWLDLVILRPETVESFPAKMPPTATNFKLSTAEETRVGRKEIANGVKQQLSGIRFLGVETFYLQNPPAAYTS